MENRDLGEQIFGSMVDCRGGIGRLDPLEYGVVARGSPQSGRIEKERRSATVRVYGWERGRDCFWVCSDRFLTAVNDILEDLPCLSLPTSDIRP